MAKALGPGLLTLGEPGTTREFSGRVTKAALEPSFKDGDAIDFLDGTSDVEPDEENWKLNGTMQQQLDKDAIEDWCLENSGTELPFVFVPNGGATDKHYSGTVRVRAVSIGGDVKKKNTSDFEFPVLGRPTLVAAD